MSPDPLHIWTIYKNHPTHPGKFIAVKAAAHVGPVSVPLEILGPVEEIDELREQLRGKGLFMIVRDPKDDASIMESWL